jgi:DNA primase
MPSQAVAEDRLEELLADAGEFFESYFWESGAADAARKRLAEQGVDEKTLRRFGVGYAPVGPDQLMAHLHELGYSTEEMIAAGLARVSGRGRAHAYFRSRIMFPIRDRGGQIVGFAGQGTHLGPSWPEWVISPDVGLYRRSEAVFGLDQAAKKIVSTKSPGSAAGRELWTWTWMGSGSSPSSIRVTWRRPACRRPTLTGSRRPIWS